MLLVCVGADWDANVLSSTKSCSVPRFGAFSSLKRVRTSFVTEMISLRLGIPAPGEDFLFTLQHVLSLITVCRYADH